MFNEQISSMSFIEETEKGSPLSKVSISAGGENTRRLHLAGNTEGAFFQIYKDHPRIESLKVIWNQHKLTNYTNASDNDLWLQFYDYATLTHLRDQEFEDIVKLSWATGKEVNKEVVGAYRCIVGKNEFLKYVAVLSTLDKHDIIFSHTVTNFFYNTVPTFKRAWNKQLEEFVESLEQVGQKEVWSLPYTKENLASLPVTDETRFYLIEWNNNRRKLRVSKDQFYNDTAEAVIAHDREGEATRVKRIPSQYQ